MYPLAPLPAGVPWTVLGLMAGTSADGADAALIRVAPAGFRNGAPFLECLGHRHEPYPPELRQAVLAAAADRMPPSGLCILQRRLGEHHARTAGLLAEELGLHPHMASLHGQTVQHRPAQGATLQLADPYLMAERLHCPVVWDLRRRDLALGGQGAPLVPLTELWLHGRERPWVALNLGGIANATAWDGSRLRAWDLGPAMSLLDLAAERWLGLPFDPDGGHAQGLVAMPALERWLGHPYFRQPPPKSTGREQFGEAWLEAELPGLEALPLPDRMATLAAFTAEAVARELRAWGPALPPGTPLLVSGGGGRHRRVRRELAQRLPELRLEDDLQFRPGVREAVSWALLGAASAAGVAGSLPEVTGASRAAVLGSWVPG
ncbi:MAG: anhydro-N-acetylmuramic acid kinase [Holophaga sp.]|nr:anhydro-N-acetylmuramic acid kinase [Holophaga sp.]